MLSLFNQTTCILRVKMKVHQKLQTLSKAATEIRVAYEGSKQRMNKHSCCT